MSRWWYITVYKCTECGATREEYDHTAPWYDSGLSGCPIVDTMCDECWTDKQEQDKLENE